MLALAVAIRERDGGPTFDPIAGEVDPSLDAESRVVARAERIADGTDLPAAIHRASGAGTFVALAAIALAGVGGIAAAQAALSTGHPDAPLNVLRLLGGVLFPQTLILVAWLVLAVFGPPSVARISLGGLLARGMKAVAERVNRGSAGAAVSAMGMAFASGSLARWTIGALTNGLWSAFNIGLLASVLWILTVRQFQFGWESTLLSVGAGHRLIDVASSIPDAVGFPTPDAAQVASARFDPAHPELFDIQTQEDRSAWSGLLIGSVVCYAMAPRLLLLGLSLSMRRRAQRNYRLPLESALLAPTVASLSPMRAPIRPSAGDVQDARRRENDAIAAGHGGEGPLALLGVELEPPASGWPPRSLRGATDLGRIESREDRERALARLAGLSPRPRGVVVVASLTSVPDRGIESLIRELASRASAPISIVLTGGERLRRRTDASGVAQRVGDWRDACAQAGVERERVVEIDLDRLTSDTERRLARIGDDEAASAQSERRLERGFELIASTAREWQGRPSEAQRAELHRALARLHGSESRRFADLLPSLKSFNSPERARSAIATAAARVRDLVPPSLRVSPKWAAAGAAAGALGCAAAATLLFPATIASLPLWAAIGGGVGGVLSSGRSAGTPTPEEPDEPNDSLGPAIRAAALDSVVLDLQGRGEALTARVIERTFAPLRDASIADADAAQRWLNAARHEFDLALAEESR